MCSYFKGRQTWESIQTLYIKYFSLLYHLTEWVFLTIRATNCCFTKTKRQAYHSRGSSRYTATKESGNFIPAGWPEYKTFQTGINWVCINLRSFANRPHKNATSASSSPDSYFQRARSTKLITTAVIKTTLFLDAQDHFSDKYCQLQTNIPVGFFKSSEQWHSMRTDYRVKSLLIEEQSVWYCNLENLCKCTYQVHTSQGTGDFFGHLISTIPC